MLHPFFDTTTRTLQYIAIWVLYAVIQTFIFIKLIPVTTNILLTDSIIHAFIFGILGILLWSVIRYGNFEVLALHQRLVNYIALAIIGIGTWLAGGYYSMLALFGDDVSTRFITILPTRAFIGLLLYLLLIQYLRLVQWEEKQNSIANAATDPVPEDTGETTEPASETELHPEIIERIAVKSGSKIHVVLTADIIYIQAYGDYVHIFTTQGKYLKEQTMKYFETHLPPAQFVRVHRSVIVNVEMISRIELYEKQSQQLTLKNGQQIKTSLSGYKALRATLNL